MKYLRDATYVVGGYVVRGGRVLLLWHGGLSRWVPTGGRIELASGEYPHEALIREVREETGLEVRAARLLAVYDNHTWRLPSIATHAYYVIFECERIGGELTPSIETSDFRWVGLDDLDGLTLYKTHLHKVPNVLRLYAERAPADYH